MSAGCARTASHCGQARPARAPRQCPPAASRSSARVRVDRNVHRSRDSGSPRDSGSTIAVYPPAGPATCAMSGVGTAAEDLAGLYAVVRPHLDERQRRVLLGAHAAQLGQGGINAVAAATGVHPDTVARGVREAAGQPEPRVRAPGAGRRPVTAADPGLVARADCRGASVLGADGRVAAEDRGLLAAGQHEGGGGQAAPGPGRLPGRRGPGDLG
jgi:hypothetical protein